MVEDVLAWLRGGELRVGDKLPTESDLRDRYGISITSVRK
ncbi:MAG: GntR family transcriptional regulator, partial [Rhodocyclales bacterium CG_4_10_14_3_um_filter_68_10]